MCVILAVTNNNDSNIKLVQCEDKEDALSKMYNIFQNLCYGKSLDYSNTYFDKDIAYAQVVNNFEQIEIRVGNLI